MWFHFLSCLQKFTTILPLSNTISPTPTTIYVFPLWKCLFAFLWFWKSYLPTLFLLYVVGWIFLCLFLLLLILFCWGFHISEGRKNEMDKPNKPIIQVWGLFSLKSDFCDMEISIKYMISELIWKECNVKTYLNE